MNPDLPDDFEETVIETFYEIETEEQITMILAELLDDVVQAIEDFEITHSVTRDRLLELATRALAEQTDLAGEADMAVNVSGPGTRHPSRLKPCT